ncbi:hypothetical protein J2X31_003482 [Flavobacterium arsenatis]|uniref:Transposase InsH N-terminal domain-containing protein n=1 Tax=Flavobacterium arsenatis TaxID=1484332 RepID=A0ABU1TUA0_9FLAO|nr:hypothetical protein [Flavobacterium arsenatis]MDR6969451.1 hypothetical protein [Flavobacterium arsenatis]
MMGLIWGQIYEFITYEVLETDALALIETESPEFEKFIFPDRKERPTEAPFMALEKLLFQMRT